jgi:uncharacterized SAM-binding protein YcdF (DUF218 family)
MSFDTDTDLPGYPVTRRPHRLRGWLLALLFVVVVAAAAWWERVPLLRGAADFWIVSDVLHPADAVVVLGGGLPVRPAAAASYYRAGLVTKVLISNVHLDGVEMLGVVPSHTSLNRTAVVNLGVPDTAIELFGTDLTNTHEEVAALRDWALRTHAQRVIVPTEVFSSRRVRWMLHRVFAGTGVEIQVAALDPTEYSRDAWWRSEKGLISFQNEIIKYVYYRLKY